MFLGLWDKAGENPHMAEENMQTSLAGFEPGLPHYEKKDANHYTSPGLHLEAFFSFSYKGFRVKV